MAIVRFDPFRDLAQMQDRINRIFGEAYRRSDGDDVLKGGDWTPPVDNSTLTLRGERKQEQEVSKESFHRIERAYGTFTRSFSLPSTVATEKVSAAFADGILTVKLPTREEAKPRQIQVQVN